MDRARAAEKDARDALAARELADKAGYCHCCRQETLFETTGQWLRDQYLCGRCLSVPRQRHTQMVLDVYFPGWEGMTLHESSPSHPYIEQFSTDYSSSQYLEGVPRGEYADGVRSEDLQALTFDDETFDIVVTQDVFEHVFDPAAAAREISRVLKPGGAHVFTAPRRRTLRTSRPRMRLTDGAIEYLLDAEYHGSPVGDGRALVTWDYGLDFEQLYEGWSGGPVTTFLTRDRSLGLDGEYLDVFVSRKSAPA